jgi:hypothetical protein
MPNDALCSAPAGKQPVREGSHFHLAALYSDHANPAVHRHGVFVRHVLKIRQENK